MKLQAEDNLVLRAQLDSGAFGELVEAHHKLILWQCYRRVKDWYHAEDLAQEVFIRAYTRLDQLREPARFRSWLQRIAGNLCSEFMRSQARYELLIKDVAKEISAAGPSLDFDLGLDALPEKTRRCVELFYISGLSYSEIARSLDTTVTAVKGRLARAKNALRKEMAAMASTRKSPFTERVMQTLLGLESEGADQRAQAAGKLGRALGEDPVERHLALLEDPDPTERGAAVRSSRRLHSPRIRDALVGILLSDAWEENRMKAANALVAQGDPSVIPHLEKARRSPDNPQEVAAAAKSAIRQLEGLGPPTSQEADDLKLRQDIKAAAQDKQARVELLQRIKASLADPDSGVRAKAIRACLGLGDKRVAPALASLLSDPVAGIRNAVARALGSLGGKRAVDLLIRAMQTTEDRTLLLNAIMASAEIGDPKALPHVVEAIDRGMAMDKGEVRLDPGACFHYFMKVASGHDLPALRPALEQLTTRGRHKGPFWYWWGLFLAKHGEEQHMPEMIEALEHLPGHPELMSGLVRIGGPKALPVIKESFLSHPTHSAAHILSKFGETGLEVLRAGLRSDSTKMRGVSAHGIRMAKRPDERAQD